MSTIARHTDPAATDRNRARVAVMTADEAWSICYNLYHDARSISSRSTNFYIMRHFEQVRDLYAGVLRPGMTTEALALLRHNPALCELPGYVPSAEWTSPAP